MPTIINKRSQLRERSYLQDQHAELLRETSDGIHPRYAVTYERRIKVREHCAINDALGGGVFTCKKRVSPEGNGSYCAYHGKAGNNEVTLTWRAWLKAKFYYLPKETWRRIRTFPRQLQWKWRRRKDPKCYVKTCREKADTTELSVGGQESPVCWGHKYDG